MINNCINQYKRNWYTLKAISDTQISSVQLWGKTFISELISTIVINIRKITYPWILISKFCMISEFSLIYITTDFHYQQFNCNRICFHMITTGTTAMNYSPHVQNALAYLKTITLYLHHDIEKLTLMQWWAQNIVNRLLCEFISPSLCIWE